MESNKNASPYSTEFTFGSASNGCAASTRAHTLFVTVILPVRDEGAFIGGTLQQLLSQDYPSDAFEILVIDGGSRDGTREIVETCAAAHPQVRLLDNPKRLSSSARNIGVRAARGEIIVVVDGHCQIPDRRHLYHLVTAFQTSGADCVGRPQPLDVTDTTNLQLAIAAARASRLGHHPDSFVYSNRAQFVPAMSVGVAYRRSVFEKIGLFDESFDACEDVDFNYRLDRHGLRCFFTPSVAVYYHPRSSLRELFQQLARYGRGRARLLRKHPTTFSLKSLLPALFLLGLVVGIPAGMIHSGFALVVAAVLVAYLCVIALGTLVVARTVPKWRVAMWLPCVFATIHLAAGWGVLQELYCGSSRTNR